MTFYSYVTRNHKGVSTEADRLAREMRMDKERFPKNNCYKLKAWKNLVYSYLCDHPELYAGCMDVFENCWEEYARCEKNRLSRSSSAL